MLKSFQDDVIMLVDDDPACIQAMHKALQGLAKICFATSGADAIQLLERQAPTLLLLDAMMPGMSGFQVCEWLKAQPQYSEIPLIFVTSHNDAEVEVAGLNLGASDFIAKPINPGLLYARVRTQLRLRRLVISLHELSDRDSLSQASNAKVLSRSLDSELARSHNSGAPLSLLMIDIDHFTAYNQLLGNRRGDDGIARIGTALLGMSAPPGTVVARLVGGRFAILLPEVDDAAATAFAERALDAVEALSIDHPDSPLCRHVTVSIGVASFEPSGARVGARPDASVLLHASATALRAAKADGRACLSKHAAIGTDTRAAPALGIGVAYS